VTVPTEWMYIVRSEVFKLDVLHQVLSLVLLRFLKPKRRFTVQTDTNQNHVPYNSNNGFRFTLLSNQQA